jgi:hypothetical protein
LFRFCFHNLLEEIFGTVGEGLRVRRMFSKGLPFTVIFSLLALGPIALIGIVNAASGLGFWWARTSDPFPIQYIGRLLVFGVVPILAILDVVRRRLVGRYLALLCMLCSAAVLLRLFMDLFLQHPRSSASLMAMPLFSLAILLCALIFSLGFNKTVDAFFQTDAQARALSFTPPPLFSRLLNHSLLLATPALSITQVPFLEEDSQAVRVRTSGPDLPSR